MLTKISEAAAQDQIDILVDYYEIEPDLMSEELAENIENSLKAVKKAITHGRVEITEEDGTLRVIQRLKKDPSQVLEYAEINGRAKTQIKDKDPSYKKVYALVGSLTGLGPKAITDLKGVDLSTVESLGTIFLQV